MAATSTAQTSDATGEIPNRTVLGGRFEIESAGPIDAHGQRYAARDQKTKKPIGIYVFARALAEQPQLLEFAREQARAAAKLRHKNLLAIYGVGTHAGDQQFLALESATGQTASELIAERRAQKRSLSVRGVYNLITHVCKGLRTLQELGCHAALRPSVVWITKSGRVKVGDLAIGSALVKAGRSDLLPPDEQAFLAPEAKTGGELDARTDVFGVGALLYALLTSRSPMDAFVIPSQARSDATPELDAVMMRCLAEDKAQRFANVDEVVRALLPLVAAAPEPREQDFGVDVEIDIDIAASLAPPGPTGSIATSIGPVTIVSDSLPPPPDAPAQPPNARTILKMTTGATPANDRTPPKEPAKKPPAADELAELTSRLTANDSPRWMAVKDGMDHGPFTARELIKLIVEGDVLEQHLLFNLSGAERKPLAKYPEFEPFVQQYRLRRDEQENAVALERSTKVEKRSTAAKFAILAACVGGIALLGGGYWVSRQANRQSDQGEADLAALYESGQVKINGTAGILRHARRAGGGRRHSGPSSGGPAGFSSYEDAMNQAVELDATKHGGERQLTSSDVAGVMNRELNRMFGCVGQELRRGGKLSTVTIDLAIVGSGRVTGASVHAGSPAFRSCIVHRLREVHFPTFPAPRMGARYSFNVD